MWVFMTWHTPFLQEDGEKAPHLPWALALLGGCREEGTLKGNDPRNEDMDESLETSYLELA